MAADPAPEPVYPPAPWAMHGSLWLTLFGLAHDADPAHRRGLWGAAFVSYVEPSPLCYSELLVARMGAGLRGTIADIWVDSPASVAGGRALWAIPKGLADFDRDHGGKPGWWSASRAGGTLASASYVDRSGPGGVLGRLPLTPFVLGLSQPALPESGGPRRVSFRGRARPVPMRARWDLPPASPLAFLGSARQLASVRLDSFAMTFG